MANEPEEERPLDADEGGPIKSFLEHLEDLRWSAHQRAQWRFSFVHDAVPDRLGNRVVGILKYPLEKAQARYAGDDPMAIVLFGTNRLGTYALNLDQWDTLTGATNGTPFFFTPESIVNFKSLAGRLKEPAKSDLVSRYLTNELSARTRRDGLTELSHGVRCLLAKWRRCFSAKTPPTMRRRSRRTSAALAGRGSESGFCKPITCTSSKPF